MISGKKKIGDGVDGKCVDLWDDENCNTLLIEKRINNTIKEIREECLLIAAKKGRIEPEDSSWEEPYLGLTAEKVCNAIRQIRDERLHAVAEEELFKFWKKHGPPKEISEEDDLPF